MLFCTIVSLFRDVFTFIAIFFLVAYHSGVCANVWCSTRQNNVLLCFLQYEYVVVLNCLFPFFSERTKIRKGYELLVVDVFMVVFPWEGLIENQHPILQVELRYLLCSFGDCHPAFSQFFIKHNDPSPTGIDRVS